MWYCIPVIPVCGSLRQEDLKLEVSLDHTAGPCHKKKLTNNQIGKKK